MPQDCESYRQVKDKLMELGTELAHARHKILLSQNRCRHFFDTWAALGFRKKHKPTICPRCRCKSPLKDFVDPLDDMLKKKREG